MLENILVGLAVLIASYFTLRGVVASLSGKPKCGGCGKCPFAKNGACEKGVPLDISEKES
ncbi:MAG: FeoB-associated Cys-rich membrane protein [Planctomycetia bacterium]|nr:FeoB-associated Cys-rich membrane protein [Planctomycetia bacterium]